jgi:U3 small nucleolar RNA-associated protein 12
LAAAAAGFSLRGHKGNITGLCFLRNRHALVSSSKDMLVKVWDLDTQHCIQTVVGHRSEVRAPRQPSSPAYQWQG